MQYEQIDSGLYQQVQALLREDGLTLEAPALRQMTRHLTVIQAWQPMVSLVSGKDLTDLWRRHVADALSLAHSVRRFVGGEAGGLLDIGSGAGFPALTLKTLFPEMPLWMIERSEKKVGFLRKTVASMGLEGVSIVHGEFPIGAPACSATVMTARAVERPMRLLSAFSGRIADGVVFICQSEAVAEALSETFHVEQVVDGWGAAGLRRGDLWIVRAHHAEME